MQLVHYSPVCLLCILVRKLGVNERTILLVLVILDCLILIIISRWLCCAECPRLGTPALG